MRDTIETAGSQPVQRLYAVSDRKQRDTETGGERQKEKKGQETHKAEVMSEEVYDSEVSETDTEDDMDTTTTSSQRNTRSNKATPAHAAGTSPCECSFCRNGIVLDSPSESASSPPRPSKQRRVSLAVCRKLTFAPRDTQ